MAKKKTIKQPITKTINISDIIVDQRLRQNIGDIKPLAKDIKAHGLLHPPVVTPTNHLIAGGRRLEALKFLGIEEITVSEIDIADAEKLVEAEYNENNMRSDFLLTEKLEYARQMEVIEKAKAEERMKSGKTEDPTENFPEGTNPTENFPEGAGEVRNIVARKCNLGSGKQYEKMKKIWEHESDFNPKDFEKWNKGELSTNKMYNKLKPPTEKRTPSFLKQTKEPNFTPEIPDISSLLPTEEIRVDNCLKHYKYFFENAYDLIQELLQAYEPAMEFIFNKRGLGTKDAENKARMEYIRDWAIQFAGIPKGYKRIDNEKIPVLASNEEQYEFIKRANKREQQNQLSIEKGMIAVNQVLEQERIDALNGNPINENEGNYIF